MEKKIDTYIQLFRMSLLPAFQNLGVHHTVKCNLCSNMSLVGCDACFLILYNLLFTYTWGLHHLVYHIPRTKSFWGSLTGLNKTSLMQSHIQDILSISLFAEVIFLESLCSFPTTVVVSTPDNSTQTSRGIRILVGFPVGWTLYLIFSLFPPPYYSPTVSEGIFLDIKSLKKYISILPSCVIEGWPLGDSGLEIPGLLSSCGRGLLSTGSPACKFYLGSSLWNFKP